MSALFDIAGRCHAVPTSVTPILLRQSRASKTQGGRFFDSFFTQSLRPIQDSLRRRAEGDLGAALSRCYVFNDRPVLVAGRTLAKVEKVAASIRSSGGSATCNAIRSPDSSLESLNVGMPLDRAMHRWCQLGFPSGRCIGSVARLQEPQPPWFEHQNLYVALSDPVLDWK